MRELWLAPSRRTARRAAFFDVDDTITTRSTMFRVLEFLFARLGHPPQAYRTARQRLRDMMDEGLPREHNNRVYYTNLADLSVDRVGREAADWFAAELAAGSLFNPTVLDALDGHRRDGNLVVLVSGSFPACLLLARHLGADGVVCSLPEAVDGRYTGRLAHCVIGAEKAVAVRELAARRGISLAESVAYGDHLSDRDMLAGVGTPVVVGTDSTLVRHARDNGWRLLGAGNPERAR